MQHAAGPRFHHRRACARDGYKAIFLGIGLPKGRKLPLPGADNEGVIDGMDFLRAFNAGTPLPLGKRIVVIGGGNVAYDVARSAVRPHDDHVAYDVARSALRISARQGSPRGVPGKPRRRCPPTRSKCCEGAEEGIHLHNQRGPREVLLGGRQADGAAHGALHRGVRRAAAASTRRSTKATWRTSPPTA